MMFGGTFAIRQFAFCNGTQMPVSGNESQYSLLGTIYGGDGRSTYGLPDLRGRLPMHRYHGSAPGGVPAQIGQRAGIEDVTLTASEIPAHSHGWQTTTNDATDADPAGLVLGKNTIYTDDTVEAVKPLYDQSVSTTGSAQSHANMMPYLPLAFIIALQGVYPSRS